MVIVGFCSLPLVGFAGWILAGFLPCLTCVNFVWVGALSWTGLVGALCVVCDLDNCFSLTCLIDLRDCLMPAWLFIWFAFVVCFWFGFCLPGVGLFCWLVFLGLSLFGVLLVLLVFIAYTCCWDLVAFILVCLGWGL